MVTDAKEKERAYWKHLVSKYPVEQRYEETLRQIQDLLEALEIMDKVQINEHLLQRAVINYFEDIDRLKEFGDIKNTNEDKIYAYQIFWLLRNKPIQIISEEIGNLFLHINEKLFTMMLVSKMLREAGIEYENANPKLYNFIELLYYNFKYRIFTQKSLELMISGFFCGCSFKEDS